MRRADRAGCGRARAVVTQRAPVAGGTRVEAQAIPRALEAGVAAHRRGEDPVRAARRARSARVDSRLRRRRRLRAAGERSPWRRGSAPTRLIDNVLLDAIMSQQPDARRRRMPGPRERSRVIARRTSSAMKRRGATRSPWSPPTTRRARGSPTSAGVDVHSRRRFGGDGRARTRLDGPGDRRRDADADARGHARRPAAARRRRSAVRIVSGVRRAAVDARRPLHQGGGRHGREARRRRPDAVARPRARGRGHSGDGPHRADAAVGDAARRIQGAGPDRAPTRIAFRQDALALEEAGLLRHRGRSRARSRRGAHHRGGRASRRSGSARARRATARCSSGTICSGCPTGACRGSSSSTPTSPV